MKTKSAWAMICEDGKYLFTQRSPTTSRPGQWCPPGGGIQNAESPENACVREVLEEVGLTLRGIPLICEEEGFAYFQCESPQRPALISLAPRECSDFRGVLPRDLLALGPIMELKRMQRVFTALGSSAP